MLAVAILVVPAATATAQNPANAVAGVDLSAPVIVPAGQTTTVDIGVPLGLNTSQDGFSFTSTGTSVSVTAPAAGGTTVVPVSYGGFSTSITVVAEQGATEATMGGATADELAGSANSGAEEPTMAAGGEQAATPRPPRSLAPVLDTAAATHIDLVGQISGNTLTVQLSVTQALNLYNQFGGTDPSQVNIRYVDGDGQLIEGVERTIDKAARTLTLTYPQGQTPDNPFIIQALKASDGSALALVTITTPGQLTTKAGGTANIAATSDNGNTKLMGLAAVGIVGLLFALGLVISLVLAIRKRSR